MTDADDLKSRDWTTEFRESLEAKRARERQQWLRGFAKLAYKYIVLLGFVVWGFATLIFICWHALWIIGTFVVLAILISFTVNW